MSYILDALRRADAERARGAVPGLNAQNIPADPEPAARNFSPLIWAAGGAGALLVAVVVVLVFAPWRSGGAPDPHAPLAPASQLADRSPANAAGGFAPGEAAAPRPGALEPAALPVEPPIARDGQAGLPRQPPPDEMNPPRTGTPPPGLDRLTDPAAAGRYAATVSPAPRPPVAQAARTPTNAGATPAAVEHYGAPAAPARANANANAAAIASVNELPADVRAQLPRLAVGGAIYSPSQPDRMLILNGQVFHEGDKPAPDTVLEQIRLKSAVLNFRGQRYEITY